MPEYYWNSKTGRYHDRATNRFVKKNDVLNFLDRDIRRTEGRMESLARQLIDGEISLGVFENAMSEEIKRNNLRATMLGSGGQNNVTPKAYGAAGNRIREEYGFLRNFVGQIQNEQLTASQIISRSKMYAKAAIAAHSRAELIDRESQGIRFAKRFLDPAVSKHCPSCPFHERLDWTPINEIVPVGYDCECRRHCRCNIEYLLGNVNTLASRIAG